MVSAWYSGKDHLDLLRALAHILPERDGSVCAFMGREAARRDLKGVYRTVVSPGDPVATLKRCVLYWQIYHDTGRLLLTFEGPGRARLDITGYEMASKEMCEVIEGWYLEALRMAGAAQSAIEHTRCVARKEPWCRFEVRWEASHSATVSSLTAR